MSDLDVPGARLHFGAHGRGPLLVLVPGATGSAISFANIAPLLRADYTVVAYDRRGFSRSALAGPLDDNDRLATDAEDIRRLIEHLGDEPAIVVGASSGAIVALDVLTRHPSVVRLVVPFEPPAVRLLVDGQRWVDFFEEVYDSYRHSGIGPALARFQEQAFPASDRQAMSRVRAAGNAEQVVANAAHWFEHELRQYPAVQLDFDALAAHADRIVPAAGRASRGLPCHRVTVELAGHLGRGVTELPGGHVGYLTDPADFARDLLAAIR